MDQDRERGIEVEFLERELDLCHAFLDIAGPKRLASLLSKAREGYENVLHLIDVVNDPGKLSRLTPKLNRLRERLSANSPSMPSTTKALSAKAAG
jgi:hypothetical protein